MRYQIVARRMSVAASGDFRHIAYVQWQQTGVAYVSSRQQMVAALESGDTAYVQGRNSRSEVGIYEENGFKYLRTYANQYWDDNLLALPTF